VLGGARLLGRDEPLRLERRTAAVLAYLAMEGPIAKYQLAGLLWPESREETARNNMRQLLHRLRGATGAELVVGEARINLSDSLAVDAAELEAHALAGRNTQALALSGELLAGLDFADCSELDAWLQRARERLLGLRCRAADAEADRLERQGEFGPAIERVLQRLDLDPCAEEAWRRLMRLHYLAGDRAAALAAFARCRLTLQQELDTPPMPETQKLARQIELGAQLSRPVAQPRASLPVTVLRPPALVGREKEWMQLEEAWEAGQFVVIIGEPGVGKSRLARDFAASKGNYLLLDARPGDRQIPYATAVRSLRGVLARRRDVSLEPWIHRELARVMPELGEPPPPMKDAGEKLRFLEACTEAIYRTSAGFSALVVDDIQYVDPGTVELSEYLFAKYFPFGKSGLPPFIDCCRREELPAGSWEMFQRLLAAGQMVLIELEPLPTAAVGQMLASLELPGVERLAEDVTRFTGGNPLFIVETLKALVEMGSLESGWPERLPPPGKVRPIIQQRLGRLSPTALQLAQVAALAHETFQLELASEVLEVPLHSLGTALEELESALVLKGERFVHDLVFEAVREGIPTSFKALLHRRLAACLQRRQVQPPAIAHHWLEGGEPMRAAPFLLAAAEAEEASMRHGSAAELYTQAGDILEAAGHEADAWRTRRRAEHCLRFAAPAPGSTGL
jgi:DNA-binding SARP family transcriptional activator